MKAQTKIRNSGRASFARANAFADTRQPHMTSALTGGRGLAQKKTIVLTGCLSGTLTRGGHPKSPILRTSYVNGPKPRRMREGRMQRESRDGRTNERPTDGCGGRRSSLGRSVGWEFVERLPPPPTFLFPSFLSSCRFSIQNAMKDPQKVV